MLPGSLRTIVEVPHVSVRRPIREQKGKSSKRLRQGTETLRWGDQSNAATQHRKRGSNKR